MQISWFYKVKDDKPQQVVSDISDEISFAALFVQKGHKLQEDDPNALLYGS